MKKMLIVVMLAAVMLMLAGCGDTEQRLASLRTATAKYQQVSNTASGYAEDADTALHEGRKLLSDPNLTVPQKEDILKLIDRAIAEKAKWLAVKNTADRQVEIFKQNIVALEAQGEAGLGEELEMYGETVRTVSTALPGQFKLYAALGGILLAAIGRAIGKVEQGRSSTKLETDLVSSVDALLNTVPSEKLDESKRVLKESQHPDTRAKVIKIKSNLKS